MSNFVINIDSSFFTIILAESQVGQSACSLIPVQFQEACQNYPIIGYIFWLFTALALLTTALVAFKENLQKLFDVPNIELLSKPVEVSESQSSKLRKQLLIRLQSDITIRRKDSLHNLIKIDLEMEEQRHRVGGRKTDLVPQAPESENNNPLNRIFQVFKIKNQQNSQLQQNQKIIDFFDRNDIQGKLLILGEPGAGKTTELLSLTQDLIQRAIENKNAPIPVIFELSSWKSDQLIRDWLIKKLCDIYKWVPKKVTEQWIDNQQLIPLFDGLDKLGLENENKCIIAI
ncbi:MAG: NACHT domain-containing protein, partial [Cyanobacteria bacterium P01_F01_bin.143]